MNMIPADHYSVSSRMPLDLNEDHSHQLYSTNHQASSSTSSLSYPVFLQPGPGSGSYYWEQNHLQSNEESTLMRSGFSPASPAVQQTNLHYISHAVPLFSIKNKEDLVGEAGEDPDRPLCTLSEKIIPSSGSWDHPVAEKDENNSDLKLKVWKNEEGNENLQGEDGSEKWMPSKVRMMRRMMVSDQRGSDIASKQKCEEQKQPLSPLETDHSSNSSSNHSNITVRVCSDCHTTKTPLWRGGPRGPKSLCNACGIRQRKARRAMAAEAAASADGTILMAAEPSHVKGNKLHSKEKKSKIENAPKLKKKRKLGGKRAGRGRHKFGYEELAISLSKNLALQQVFPQDEKEAAILLMALSYGLLHGFPSDRYLD